MLMIMRKSFWQSPMRIASNKYKIIVINNLCEKFTNVLLIKNVVIDFLACILA